MVLDDCAAVDAVAGNSCCYTYVQRNMLPFKYVQLSSRLNYNDSLLNAVLYLMFLVLYIMSEVMAKSYFKPLFLECVYVCMVLLTHP